VFAELEVNTPSRRAPLFDPTRVPLDPAFDDPLVRGAPVAPEHLRPAALRQRFAAQRPWQPEVRADARLFMPDLEPRPAAVLVPLVARDGALNVLLTERTTHLADHAGQISFPGGRVEAGDADPAATALREAREEIGLAPECVEVVGLLPRYITATGYDVTPVVGLIERPGELALDPFEVAEAFEVPLAFLMDPAHHQRHVVELGAVARTYYAMPFHAQREYFIWGATAGMLRNLYQFLRA
jgi:8-oxo-dGTP pyrophosphatase MutT (NUDIX family)